MIVEQIIVRDKDSKLLTKTIVEVEAAQELYNSFVTEQDFNKTQFKELLETYLDKVSIHKEVWRDILRDYVDEDVLSYYRDALRFDVMKKVIFLPDNIEEAV